MGPQALHTCYFEKDADADGTDVKDTDAKGTKSSPDALTALKRPADAICHICEPQNHKSTDGINIDPDNLKPGFNLLALYAAEFFDEHKPPINTACPGRGWEDIHDDVITGGSAGALYNASYAVDRRQIDKVIPLICKAVEHIPATFIFTMRFVSQPAGTLAFTRFAETVVIEIDGIHVGHGLDRLVLVHVGTGGFARNPCMCHGVRWRHFVCAASDLRTTQCVGAGSAHCCDYSGCFEPLPGGGD